MKRLSNRSLMSLFLLLFLALPGVPVRAQAVDAAALDAVIEEALKYWQTPGAAVVVISDGKVAYLKGFGVRDLKTKQPVTADTVFAIGSTTKAFTTAAMALLVDEGKMQWDDPVRKHLASFRLADPLASENVTMRDLVTHRTGLSRHDLLWFGSPWSRAEILRRIGLVPLSQSFRSVFQYQNIMYLAAGEAVAATSGSSYEDFIRQRIFLPLGMKNASLSVIDAQKSPDHATPHFKRGARIEAMPWRNLDNVGPAGSINASISDLSAWIQLQLGDGTSGGKRLISADNLREMHTPQMTIRLEGRWKLFFPENVTSQLNYGLGWFITDYRGQHLVMHGGTIDGFRASIMLAPKKGIGIAVLANLNQTQMPEATCYNLLDRVLGLPPLDWNSYIGERARLFEAEQVKAFTTRYAARKTGARPSLPLSAYAGEYFDPAYGSAIIRVEGAQLVVAWSSLKSKLEHFHFDTFLAREERLATELVQFQLSPDGEVESMRFLSTTFRKEKPAAR
ncbi:MAG: serine hydrolase [Acidobacteriota bacterium]|nr:MAG: serine hydrolase [Acidobacteriota bacterium]